MADDGQGYWARGKARMGSELGEDGSDEECGYEPNQEEDARRLHVSHFYRNCRNEGEWEV